MLIVCEARARLPFIYCLGRCTEELTMVDLVFFYCDKHSKMRMTPFIGELVTDTALDG